jgi:hypothetical protein
VPDLDAHVAAHPWREDAWRLLALALYRAGRQGDALGVLRRARAELAGQLGLDPGPELGRLETGILRRERHLDPASGADPAARVWAQAAAVYDRAGTRDLLFEALWCLAGRAAIAVGDAALMERARRELAPAAAELAGAASGLLTLGPVAGHLAGLDAALARH